METLDQLTCGVANLPLLSDAETRSISAENPTGERGGGARAIPDARSAASELGQGWKVRPCITLEPEATTTLADIEGAGIIQHIWIAVMPGAYRTVVLRFYWDEEDMPSVEVPLGDFFCNGHGLRYDVNSLLVAVNPVGGFSSYWPMPFARRARITVENQSPDPIGGFYYQITYALSPVPTSAGRFHAQWRRSTTTPASPEHVIVEGLRGQGHYVGTFLAWTQLSNGWWGEGEVKFYIDGDLKYPTICGTGTEDYFLGAWGFCGDWDTAPQTYSSAFAGYPLCRREQGEVLRHGLYRWHVLDPIRFKRDLRVTIQALGVVRGGDKFVPLADDIASVGYWYQTEPHASSITGHVLAK